MDALSIAALVEGAGARSCSALCSRVLSATVPGAAPAVGIGVADAGSIGTV